ncbi:hypothetical protein [Sandarakinorhabdus oryzae]|uniref:hypothetical protein n=1 Tax=Sandarakinorhabdus oryzae TaxID=2675220 RepID=UPI0012E25066|nr:hypothetical protein [Sandarakinorhabdus oryzae]
MSKLIFIYALPLFVGHQGISVAGEREARQAIAESASWFNEINALPRSMAQMGSKG